jgi:plastocyanin domain-containing protein
MNPKTIWALAAAITLGTPLVVRAQQYMWYDPAHETSGRAAPSGGSHAAAAHAKRAPRTIEIAVTSGGFVPAEVKVKKGETVRLAITRKTGKTCATEFVMNDFGINRSLPLNETIYVEFTPTKLGRIDYACGMKMVSGVLVVE